MKKLLTLMGMLPMFYSLPTFADADSDKMAQTLCAGCHGPTGISTNPLWPNLAGQKDQYSAKQMRAYRDGTRTDPNMSALMQGLSDEDISELAAYYAKLPDGS